jgi:hypothetical protein
MQYARTTLMAPIVFTVSMAALATSGEGQECGMTPEPTPTAVSTQGCVDLYLESLSCPPGCEVACACVDYYASYDTCLSGCEEACDEFDLIAVVATPTATPYNGDIEYSTGWPTDPGFGTPTAVPTYAMPTPTETPVDTPTPLIMPTP